MPKLYKDKLELAFDLMKSVRANYTGNREMGVSAGAFQFSAPRVNGQGNAVYTLRNNREKMAMVNRMCAKSLHAPVSYNSFDGKAQQIQAFTGSSSMTPVDMGQAWTPFVNEREYDVGYRKLFKLVSLKPNSLEFSIGVGSKGARMKKIAEGGRVEVAGFSSEKLTVTCEKYGLAFGVTWEMMEGNDFNAFKDAFQNYEDELYGTTADVHYAVVRQSADDSSNSPVTYQSGTDTLEKDINTINEARVQLLEQTKESYGNSANAKLYIVADIKLQDRISRAIKSVNNPYDKAQINGNIEPIFTMNENIRKSASTETNQPLEPILVLPGKKLQDAVHTENLALSEMDIYSLTNTSAGWTAFGVGNGDIYQAKRFYMHS